MRTLEGILIAGLIVAAAVVAPAAQGQTARATATSSLDLTRLRLGDGRVTLSGARRGYVWACQSGRSGPLPTGPWITGSYWNFNTKPTVDGSVRWSGTYSVRTSGSRRVISGNGLPRNHRTGNFPIRSSDDAYRYDRNPNRIASQNVSISVPANPAPAARRSCVPGGPIGYLDSGVALFNALDAGNFDAGAHEIQDRCGGHPAPSSDYHYHTLPRCLNTGSTRAHSIRIGWALDGFPIYGPRGDGGKYLRNTDLDTCHGHTHTIRIDGRNVRRYHYHATMEYPYTLGCFRGTPVRTQQGPPAGGTMPPGGPPSGGPPPA